MTSHPGSGTDGRRWLGRYELIRPLAQGGMAELYLARRAGMPGAAPGSAPGAAIDSWLVIKCMRPEFAGNPKFVDMFVREARLAMGLVHRNIVPVFDFGKVGDQVFLAMQRIEGRDLGLSLARAASHRLPPVVAAYIAAECCQALDHAHRHARGVVHRDVTPRNVLLSWSGEVLVTDFGIAAFVGDTARRPLGTPQYMAPEQARREPIDPRADLYACGLVLREAISGVCARPGDDAESSLASARRGELLPWPAATPADTAPATEPQTAPHADHAAMAVHAARLEPRSCEHQDDERRLDLASGDEPLPPALIAIIDRATAARPADRYPDARAMLDELDGFIIAHRAAHGGPSPARQLVQWLAAVWGNQASHEAGAAELAPPLGADGRDFDAIGASTVRSLAATADDIQA